MKQNQLYTLILLLSIIMLFSFRVFGQECGFKADDAFIEHLKVVAQTARNSTNLTRPESAVTLGLKVYRIHKRSNAIDITAQDVNRVIAYGQTSLNNSFSPIGVFFELCGDVIDIPNDDLASLEASNSGSNDERIIAQDYYDRRIINIYIVDEITTPTGGLLGYTRSPPVPYNDNFNRIFYTKTGFLDKNTAPHEMGHFFGLLHTFGNNGDCNPNKSLVFNPNDAINDDLVEDTPIDPGMDCPTNSLIPCSSILCLSCDCSYVDNNCNYVGKGGYARFASAINNTYPLLVNNFMNYSSNYTCPNSFTTGQYNLMRQNVSERQHLVCPVNNPTCNDTYYEPNNDFLSASNEFGVLGASSFSTAIQGKISRGYGDDLDYFKVRFTQVGDFRVRLTGLTKNYDLKLFEVGSLRKFANLTGLQSEDMFFTVTAADLNKDFFILVYGAASADFDCTNPYTLSVTWLPQSSGAICSDQFEPNNSESNPNLTAFSTPLGTQRYSNTITAKVANGDIDVFKFKVTQSGSIRVRLSVQNLSYICRAQLLKGEGLTQLGTASYTGSSDGDFTYAYQGGTAEVFYIKCKAPNMQDCNATYKLTLEWIPATAGVGCTDIYEPNNSLSQVPANASTTFGSIANFVDFPAKIGVRGDVDWYKFRLTNPGTVQLYLFLPQIREDYDLYFYDANGNEIARSDESGNEREFIAYRYTGTGSQDFYVKVQAYNNLYNCDSLYKLRLNFLPSGNQSCNDTYFEPNNSFNSIPTAGTASFGTTNASTDFYALISTPTDKDYFKIQTTSKGKLFITLSELPADFDIELYDASQNRIAKSDNYRRDNELIEWTVSNAPQTYYLKVYSYYDVSYDCVNKYHLNISWTPQSTGGGGGTNCNGTLDCSLASQLNFDFLGDIYLQNQTFPSTGNCITRYSCATNTWGNQLFNGNEKIFKFDLTEDRNNLVVNANYFPPCNGLYCTLGFFQYQAFVFNSCNTNTCISPNQYGLYDLPRGTYYVVVDDYQTFGNIFNLFIGNRRAIFYTLGAGASDTCVAEKPKVLGYECGVGNSTYKVRFKYESSQPATITVTNYILSNMGNGNYELAGIPSGEKGMLNAHVSHYDTINRRQLECDFPIELAAFTCSCLTTISPPTNPTHRTICDNELPINISVDAAPTGSVVQWYDAPVNGTLLGSGNNFSATESGIYFAEIADNASGCASERIGVRVAVLPRPNIKPVMISPTCDDKNDGAISLILSDSATYQFTWNTGARTKDINQLLEGNYIVTIIDTNNCQLKDTFYLKAPPKIQVSLETNLTCNQNVNNSITAIPVIFETPLSYRWNTGDTSAVVRNITSGTYKISVTDSRGCHTVDSIEVANNTFYSQAAITSISCKGRTDGRISVSAVNGEAPFTYQWSNGRSTPQLDSLRAGKYAISVTDRRGCVSIDTIEVTEPDSLKLYVNKSNPTCVDSTNGKIAVYVDGGNGLYAYQWNTQATSYNLANISAGIFNVQVKDRLNCVASTTIDIQKPDSIRLNPIIVSNPCVEQQKGEINLQVNGGKSPYKYVWERGDTLAKIVGLVAGNYSVTVMDSNRCVVKKAVQVNTLPALESRITAISTKCSYTQDGILKIDTLIGFPPYQIGIDAQGNSTNRNFTNLTAGQHKVIILDTFGCKWEKSFEIKQPLKLGLVSLATPISCKNRNDGRIGVSPVNGELPLSYQWNNGKTTPQLDSLRAGRYTITVTDRQGCISADTINITEPDSLKLYVNKSNQTCVDSTNGKIAVYVEGGNGLYSYLWNTQATTANLTNISSGTYTIQVKDRLNCMVSATIDIQKPDSIRLNPTIVSNPCAEQQKGAITLQVTGGTSPYKYVWQGGDTLGKIVGLSAGNYNVTVVDSNKCVVKKAYQVNNLPPLESRITAIGTKCSYTQDGILKIDTLIGFPPYQIGIDARDNSTSRSFPNQRAGQHNLIIFDTYGCKWEKLFEIKQAPELTLVVATSNGDSLLKLGEKTDLSVSSRNYTLQTVQWQPPTALSCATCPTTAVMPFSTTTYKVKVKTTEGCEGTAEKQIKVSTERPVFAPTAFSPNGDNNNDYFTLFGPIGAKQVKTLKIFNRWGNMVFTRESFPLNDLNLGWDGTYRGQAVDEGIYIYYAEVEFVNGQIIKVQGDVSVIK
jgi:gliding motility-associated-like protein